MDESQIRVDRPTLKELVLLELQLTKYQLAQQIDIYDEEGRWLGCRRMFAEESVKLHNEIERIHKYIKNAGRD